MRYIGGVSLNEYGVGRKKNVYCTGWTPSARKLLHEVLLTQEILPFWRAGLRSILRGEWVDEELRPDATLILPEKRIHLELDNGTESYGQVGKRMTAYGQCQDTVVWIAPTETRLAGIEEVCLPEVCLFSVQGSGVWRDVLGNETTVEELCEQTLLTEVGENPHPRVAG